MINQERAKFDKPVIIAGDFNAKPESELMRDFIAGWQLVSVLETTYPANNPDRIIDYSLVGSATKAECISSEILKEPEASDHRPVFSVIKL